MHAVYYRTMMLHSTHDTKLHQCCLILPLTVSWLKTVMLTWLDSNWMFFRFFLHHTNNEILCTEIPGDRNYWKTPTSSYIQNLHVVLYFTAWFTRSHSTQVERKWQNARYNTYNRTIIKLSHGRDNQEQENLWNKVLKVKVPKYEYYFHTNHPNEAADYNWEAKI